MNIKPSLFIAAIIGVVLGLFVVSYLFMFLWNSCLVGAISGVNSISWMHAFGIMVMFGLVKTSVSYNK